MYEMIKKLADIKIILSVIGGFFVSTGWAFTGHTIWFFSNILWLKHFHDQEDKSAFAMYLVWQVQAIVGMIYWSGIL